MANRRDKQDKDDGASGALQLSLHIPEMPQMPSISWGTGGAASRAGKTAGKTSPSSPAHAAVHVLGVAALAYVGVKVTLPLLRTAGRLLFRRNTSHVQSPPPRPSASASVQLARGGEDSWQAVDADPPPVPTDYKPVATAELACSVQDFYASVVASGSGFLERQHTQVAKQWDFVQSPWQPASAGSSGLEDRSALGALNKSVFEYVLDTAGSGGYCRTVTFTQPKKPPAPVDSQCVQRQQFCVYRGDVLVLATAMNMLNIPFKECFTVNTVWQVRPRPGGGSTLMVNLKVHFLKGCLMGSIVRANTMRDSTTFYRQLAEDAAALPAGSSAAAARSGGSSSGGAMAKGGGRKGGKQLAWKLSEGQSGELGESTAVGPGLWLQMRALLAFMVLVSSLAHLVAVVERH